MVGRWCPGNCTCGDHCWGDGEVMVTIRRVIVAVWARLGLGWAGLGPALRWHMLSIFSPHHSSRHTHPPHRHHTLHWGLYLVNTDSHTQAQQSHLAVAAFASNPRKSLHSCFKSAHRIAVTILHVKYNGVSQDFSYCVTCFWNIRTPGEHAPLSQTLLS